MSCVWYNLMWMKKTCELVSVQWNSEEDHISSGLFPWLYKERKQIVVQIMWIWHILTNIIQFPDSTCLSFLTGQMRGSEVRHESAEFLSNPVLFILLLERENMTQLVKVFRIINLLSSGRERRVQPKAICRSLAIEAKKCVSYGCYFGPLHVTLNFDKNNSLWPDLMCVCVCVT